MVAKHSNLVPTPEAALQVIGAGLPRTSTASLQSGLEVLGFSPCYHTITHFLPNARAHSILWLAAMREPSAPARQKYLAELIKGYAAIVDGPGCFFVQDWVDMYPDAKVVLGLRKSPKAWLTSVEGTVGKVFGKPLIYYLAWFVPELYYGFRMNNLWDKQTRKRYGVGVRTQEFYQIHNDHIRSIVPRERLLEFQASDGWEPLARFLGRDVPEGSFPYTNAAKAANQLIRSFVVYGVGVWIAVLVCVYAFIKGAMIYLAGRKIRSR